MMVAQFGDPQRFAAALLKQCKVPKAQHAFRGDPQRFAAALLKLAHQNLGWVSSSQ